MSAYENEGEDNMKLNMNAVNQAIKDSMIYIEHEVVTSISLVIKGRVLVYNNGIKTMVGSGSFIGISDLSQGIYQSNYLAYDDTMIYTFDVQDMNNVQLILKSKKDYCGLIICSLNKYIAELAKGYFELRQGADAIFNFFNDTNEKFSKLNLELNAGTKGSLGIEMKDWYESQQVIDDKKIQSYLELSAIPLDAYKDFYGYSVTVTMLEIEEQVEMINHLIAECAEVSNYIVEVFEVITSSNKECLYNAIARTAMKVGSNHSEYNRLVAMVDDVIEEVISIENLFDKSVGRKIVVDRESMQEIYYQLLTQSHDTNDKASNEESNQDCKEAEIVEILKNSMNQILNYSGLEDVFCKETEKLVNQFAHLKDKYSLDDEVRNVRKSIANNFYRIYQEVFVRAYKEKSCPRVIDMFLKYGYMDENLLSLHQQASLYRLEEKFGQQESCQVYNIKDWLVEIYEGRKEPSKNEFDIDYRTMVRTRKNKNEITEAEEKEFYENQDRKLEYEIKNMFQYNHRLANGQVSSFIPILFEEMFLNSIEKSFVSAEKINNEMKKILQIDYSLFYREIMYTDEAQRIKREYVMREVFPDIILMPTHGNNSVMWQDISEKRRGNSGRFILPIFSDMDLFDVLVKLCGRFRWELCRTLQGVSWNDIQVKSLTSEYSSYLQFYRKNKDLSEEKKDKIKMQIQKGRSNSREVFTMDYETWIKYEVTGSVRLNKIVREIMATYCPFSIEYREKLMNQPIFEVSMVRYMREKKKKIKEMEFRLHALQKDNVVIPQELMDTKDYYNNL